MTTQRRNRPTQVRIEVTESLVLTLISFTPDRKHDADLADHVRTVLGPAVKKLDLPRIHVMAEGNYVLLHGDVATEQDAITIEGIVAALNDVESVESHLHVGLLESDTRPSESPPEQSRFMLELLERAEAIGLMPGAPARYAVNGTLGAILEQIPFDERRHLVAHFPKDVLIAIKPRNRFGDEDIHWKSELALDAAAALRGGITLADAQVLVPSVIGVLRKYVPEEDSDVSATLHAQLQELWSESCIPTESEITP